MNDTPESQSRKPLQKRLVYPTTHVRHLADIVRLVQVANDAGYELSRGDAQLAWEEYSDLHAAGWLSLTWYDDAELLQALKRVLHEC